ncbi:metallophosphoesterase [Bordetella sp. FB-8]|uniref:metallophosphoesterase n=1 Tax=Bordetella sp. FB-8 TaxID=1159870 RepID=UPI0003675062|nr:metallophosphoesterase [Bordetella sp. FB-8]
MHLQILSDLHLEANPDFAFTPAPGVDVLVLAGDIGSYQAGSALDGADFGLERYAPRGRGAGWPRVLYVPGNHEFDGLDFDQTTLRLRQTCERLGILWLEREEAIIDGIRFVGTTLWTDFQALAGRQKTETHRLQQLEKAYRAANFYLSKNTTLRGGQPVLAEDMRQFGVDCQAWLRQALSRPYAGTTVVVTHFAPTLRSADPRYGLTPGTAGFCNALDDLLPYADLWIHGHLHCPHDYRVTGQRGGRAVSCRVVANPLGYVSKGEQEGFRPDWVIELP